MPESQFKTCYD